MTERTNLPGQSDEVPTTQVVPEHPQGSEKPPAAPHPSNAWEQAAWTNPAANPPTQEPVGFGPNPNAIPVAPPPYPAEPQPASPYPASPYPASPYPTGAYPTGGYQPGSYQPGVYQPGAYQPSAYQPGVYQSSAQAGPDQGATAAAAAAVAADPAVATATAAADRAAAADPATAGDPATGATAAPGWPWSPGGWSAGGYAPPVGPPYGSVDQPVPAAPDNRPRRSIRSLAGVAMAAALIGGLVGGGVVAATDDGSSSNAVAASVSRTDQSAPSSATSTDGTVAGAAKVISPSVVTLNITTTSGSGTGSGVIIRSDGGTGYILTNDHVVSEASKGTITVTFNDGSSKSATVVGEDPSSDLAVVKVTGVSGLTVATFANSSKLTVGQSVVAIGSPLGLNGTVTAGIVSTLHRATRAGSDGTAVIDAVQTDAAINPGNSGGALVDLDGHVVGINTSIATAGQSSGSTQSSESGNIGIGFAIPSNTAANIADQLIAKGSAAHAYLGIRTQDSSSGSSRAGSSSSTSGTAGAQVESVVSGGAAAKAGLKAGDVVTKADSRLITDADDLVAAVRSYQPGDKITLTLVHGGAQQTITLTLGSDAAK